MRTVIASLFLVFSASFSFADDTKNYAVDQDSIPITLTFGELKLLIAAQVALSVAQPAVNAAQAASAKMQKQLDAAKGQQK